jgi:hypothetical protein
LITDGSDHSVQDVISKLRFIASLKPGERIDVASLSVQPDTYTGRIYRALLARGESREVTFDFIRQVLGDAFALITEYAGCEGDLNRRIREMLITAVHLAKNGITGLSETYKDDRMYVARVTTLVEALDAKLAELARVGPAGMNSGAGPAGTKAGPELATGPRSEEKVPSEAGDAPGTKAAPEVKATPGTKAAPEVKAAPEAKATPGAEAAPGAETPPAEATPEAKVASEAEAVPGTETAPGAKVAPEAKAVPEAAKATPEPKAVPEAAKAAPEAAKGAPEAKAVTATKAVSVTKPTSTSPWGRSADLVANLARGGKNHTAQVMQE